MGLNSTLLYITWRKEIQQLKEHQSKSSPTHLFFLVIAAIFNNYYKFILIEILINSIALKWWLHVFPTPLVFRSVIVVNSLAVRSLLWRMIGSLIINFIINK